MKRNAFVMHLKKGCEAKYKKRHDAIWDELKAELRKAGVSNYSIYLERESGLLFAVQNLADDATDEKLPESPIVQKWWQMMADIMETNPDHSPVSQTLEEMFHMD